MTVKREKMFDKISKDLLVMSGIVFKQLQLVSDRLNSNAAASTDEINENEHIIDGFETKIRKNVIGAILLFTPRASDLRKIIACYDISITLERIGDLTQNIDRAISKINNSSELYIEINGKLCQLLSSANTMVQTAVNSFVTEKIELTRQTIKNDDIVDGLFSETTNQLIALSAGKQSSEEDINNLLQLSSIAHNIERIADYATNIAEASVYLIEGENIQHLEL